MTKIKHAGAWLICYLALYLVGCTSAYTTTAASLIVAEKTVQAAAEQFPTVDRLKRGAIVHDAKTQPEGAAALIAWNETAEKAMKAIEGAQASVQLAADGLKGVHDGLRSPGELSTWIAPAIRVGVDLTKLLDALGVKLTLGAVK